PSRDTTRSSCLLNHLHRHALLLRAQILSCYSARGRQHEDCSASGAPPEPKNSARINATFCPIVRRIPPPALDPCRRPRLPPGPEIYACISKVLISCVGRLFV